MELTTLLCEEDMKRNARKEKKTRICFKTKIPFNAATLSLHSTSKQAINSIYIYRKRERGRERACLNDCEKWIQQTTNPIYNFPFRPCTLHRRANPHLQKRMAGASYIPGQKKISEETQNVLWCFHMCCGVFHN
jgi:hypothetical protein